MDTVKEQNEVFDEHVSRQLKSRLTFGLKAWILLEVTRNTSGLVDLEGYPWHEFRNPFDIYMSDVEEFGQKIGVLSLYEDQTYHINDAKRHELLEWMEYA